MAQVIFLFLLFLGMVMYAHENATNEKEQLLEIKNKLQHIHVVDLLWGKLLTPRIGFLMDANAFGILFLLCNQLESSFFLFVISV